MHEPPKKTSKPGWKRTVLTIVAGLALIVTIAVLTLYLSGAKFSVEEFDYIDGSVEIELIPPRESRLSRYATGPLSDLEAPAATATATDHAFVAADGSDVRLADFRGEVVVVNLWATWCAPCLAEMPTLAALAETYAANDAVRVVPISVDVPDARPKAETFIADHPPLPFYSDPDFQLPFAFGGRGGMPQTILIDRQGRVRATLTGGADWNSAEARALIDALLAET